MFRAPGLLPDKVLARARSVSRPGQLSGFRFKPGSNSRLSDLPVSVPECAPRRAKLSFCGQTTRISVANIGSKTGFGLSKERARTPVAILSIHNQSPSYWRVSALSKDVARGEAACLSCVESGPKPGLNTSSNSSRSVLVLRRRAEGPTTISCFGAAGTLLI